MGILFESDTIIEILLKNELDKNGILYEEQYFIMSGGKFSSVKYVADFFIELNGVRLIIECDGFTFHSGKQRYQQKRDSWLEEQGYVILHFSTNEIKYKMNYVINLIKYQLKIIDIKPTKFKKRKYEVNKEFDVILYCYYYKNINGINIAYMYKDIQKNVFSEIRSCVCVNSPQKLVEATAIRVAIEDLKRSVNIKVIYAGRIFNSKFKIKKQLLCFEKTRLIINKIWLEYNNVKYNKNMRWTEDGKILGQLKSVCFQEGLTTQKITNKVTFNSYI